MKKSTLVSKPLYKLLCLRQARKVLRYLLNLAEGLQYGSYTLADEADLASSFIERNKNLYPCVVIDAGANCGDWTKALLSKTKVDKLIMIEPSKAHTDSLQQIQSTISSSEIIIEQVAIGSEEGWCNLYYDTEKSGLASLYKRDLTHINHEMCQVEKVKIMTLNQLFNKYNLEKIDFLKLDLEGHELQALIGVSSLLKHHKIIALSFEFGGCNIDSRTYFKDFWNLLAIEFGYKLYRILPNKYLLALDKYSEELEIFTWQNIIACLPEYIPNQKIVK